ncbi:phospholipid-transporting ATPase 4 [Artemisia annua]|uniref:Phospholipid-transporting ATPase 4 n=1 Tax=Artemisia annua TaxID=35608 RepID=A0A2U1NDI7_ARTAN|nr:phospholipid-transporting ATPase 4 [Artemisia annua]
MAKEAVEDWHQFMQDRKVGDMLKVEKDVFFLQIHCFYLLAMKMLPKEDKKLYDPSTPLVSGVSHLVTALILLGNLIPISVYVSIDRDCEGIPYGMPSSEVEVSAANQMAIDLDGHEVIPKAVNSHNRIKGFSFEDNRVMNGNWAPTKRHLNEYAEAGLRTLAFVYRKLEASDYSSWNEEYMKARTCIGGDRDAMLEGLSNSVEKDLVLVGATAVEDKLQPGATRLVKEGTEKTTLAIGDGANDVGIIQEGDIGVGISGDKGMQAVMASDFAIAQFRFLERLLVVHGHWCYKRTAQMLLTDSCATPQICCFFYKNIVFGLTLVYFEAFTGFSGQSVMMIGICLLFNFLTSLAVISFGVSEQDVSSEICLQQGPRNLFFDWYRILGWIGNGLYCSLIVFFLNIILFYDEAFRSDGQTVEIAVVGTSMFTYVIFSVICQIALTMSHFTWTHHFSNGYTIVPRYIFLVLNGMLSPDKIFSEALAPAALHWLSKLLVAVACNVP